MLKFGPPHPPVDPSQLFTQAPYQPPRPDYSRALFPAEQKRLDEYRAFLDESEKKVLAENPGLHPATADEMKNLKKVLLENFEGQLRLPDAQSRSMWLQHRNSEYNSKYFSALTPERQYAHQLLGDEMRGPGIFDGVISNFYNSKDGGVQWGGVAGAGIGAVLGYMISGTGIGGFLEGWLGGFAAPLIMAVGGILGSWGGRVAEDYLMDYMKPKTPANKPPAQQQSTGVAREQTPGTSEPTRDPQAIAAAAEQAREAERKGTHTGGYEGSAPKGPTGDLTHAPPNSQGR